MIETTARGPRTGLVRKPRPKHWHRDPCLAAGCRRVGQLGGLCLPCNRIVAADVAADLSEAGVACDISDLEVAVNDGYVSVLFVSHGSPRRARLVHRVVMESAMGRPLESYENVHHLNGCRWDNSVSNLELWVTAQPSGQRPADLAAYARRLLARYGTLSEQIQYSGSL